MKTAKELVKQINESEICSPRWIGDFIDISGVKEVETLDLDEHRWYTVGTVVYEVSGQFFGVRGPVQLKSESMDYNDIGINCEAFEMKAVEAVTYTRK